MAAQSYSPGVKKALKYILNLILSRPGNAAASLPSLRELASRAGVSYPTMVKASARLKQLRIIDGVAGHNSALVAGSMNRCHEVLSSITADPPVSARTQSAWRNVADALRKDILTGAYAADESLPSIKELSIRYGVSYATLKKAVDTECDQGYLTRQGRRYKLRRVIRIATQKRVVLAVLGSPKGGLRLSAINEDFVRLLQVACTRSGLGLQIISYDFDHETLQPLVIMDAQGNPAPIPADEGVFGFIMMVVANSTSSTLMISELAALDKPVAVIDTCGDWDLPRNAGKRTVKVLSNLLSDRPGIDAARYLIGIGHVRVAWISPFHQSTWSRNRLAGLIETYAIAGYPRAVNAFAVDNPSSIHAYFSGDAQRECDITPLTDAFARWKKTQERVYSNEIEPLFQHEIPNILLPRGFFNKLLNRLFGRALACPDITAWVAANDGIAVSAKAFLESEGMRIPKDVALLGFDDSPLALRHNITSYHFEMSALTHRALNFIIDIHSLPASKKVIVENTGGMIIERFSTGGFHKTRLSD
ncbi:MAG: GntR family transcriptional regulator [Chitinivibrionales bacterium]|nr:GntR family transcriptional regulator [Chitinivibrionales bacterium]